MTEAQQYIGIGFGVISLLGFLNVWFIIRLVEKIDFSADAVKELKGEIKRFSDKISEIKELFDRVDELEKDVLILKHVAKTHHPESCSRV